MRNGLIKRGLIAKIPGATQGSFVDSVDQDQTACSVQSDLDLHGPTRRYNFWPRNIFESAILRVLQSDLKVSFRIFSMIKMNVPKHHATNMQFGNLILLLSNFYQTTKLHPSSN